MWEVKHASVQLKQLKQYCNAAQLMGSNDRASIQMAIFQFTVTKFTVTNTDYEGFWNILDAFPMCIRYSEVFMVLTGGSGISRANWWHSSITPDGVCQSFVTKNYLVIWSSWLPPCHCATNWNEELWRVRVPTVNCFIYRDITVENRKTDPFPISYFLFSKQKSKIGKRRPPWSRLKLPCNTYSKQISRLAVIVTKTATLRACTLDLLKKRSGPITTLTITGWNVGWVPLFVV
jgi:hypothetical protein